MSEPKLIDEQGYERELLRLQSELIKLQYWIQSQDLRVVVLFEGRDAAGKGGVIRRIMQYTNPRIVRLVALPKPTERERGQWYFQRYVAHLPRTGEMVLFRSQLVQPGGGGIGDGVLLGSRSAGILHQLPEI